MGSGREGADLGIGLGKAGTVEPATGRKATAKGRLGQADGTDAPDA